MKRKVFVLLFFACFCHGQIPIDSIYVTIKRESVHRNSIDWKTTDEVFHRQLTGAKTADDTLNAVVEVFRQLQDYHSNIQYLGRTFSNYPEFDEKQLQQLMPLVNLSNKNTGVFRRKIIDQKFLYLQVPSIQAWGNDVNIAAKALSDSLCKGNLSKLKGVVIDLRLNGGGQFSAMAGGLAMLLGEGYIGGGIDANNQTAYEFTIQSGNLWIGNFQATNVQHDCRSLASKIPVAILIGPNTRSSGSILALTFRGRKNTILIGEPTAEGYTTGNDYFAYMNGTIALNLATSFSTDRNRNVYRSSVNPDTTIFVGDDFEHPEKDEKVIKAVAWLKTIARK
ncbi:hypothetical protein FLLO111716_13100 [Flavobacterium longum]|uniref:S41 family peptidase n=1 Tax=Flavobacterium longum TaxID=1299340 RepID=UPI0039E8F6F5